MVELVVGCLAMNQSTDSIVAQFGGTFLGDARRAVRFRMLLRQLGRRPAGAVSDVFVRPAEQQAAYDFLENDLISAEDVQAVASRATARLCGKQSIEAVLIQRELDRRERANRRRGRHPAPARPGHPAAGRFPKLYRRIV